MAQFSVQLLNHDGTVCHRSNGWSSSTEGSWLSLVEAPDHEEAARLATRRWYVLGDRSCFPALVDVVEVGTQPQVCQRLRVDRIVETRYPVERISTQEERHAQTAPLSS